MTDRFLEYYYIKHQQMALKHHDIQVQEQLQEFHEVIMDSSADVIATLTDSGHQDLIIKYKQWLVSNLEPVRSNLPSPTGFEVDNIGRLVREMENYIKYPPGMTKDDYYFDIVLNLDCEEDDNHLAGNLLKIKKYLAGLLANKLKGDSSFTLSQWHDAKVQAILDRPW